MSSIFFLIYISGVFNKVSDTSFLVTSFSFINDLGFIILANSVKEIVKTFKKITKEMMEWGRLNAVTYNISKTKAIFFSKSHW